MPDLADLVLSDPDGAPVRIGDVVDRVTVIDLVSTSGVRRAEPSWPS